MDPEVIYTDCPPDKPFFNDEDCIACFGDNNLFSVTNKECTKCGEDFKYNYQFKSCLATEK